VLEGWRGAKAARRGFANEFAPERNGVDGWVSGRGGCSGTRRVSSPPHMPICDGECSVYGPHSCQQCPVHHSQHHRTLVCIFHPSSNSKGSSTNSNPRQLGNVCRLWSLGTQGISSSFLTVVKSWQFEASFCLKLRRADLVCRDCEPLGCLLSFWHHSWRWDCFLDAVRALLGIWEAWRGVLAVGEMMVRWRLTRCPPLAPSHWAHSSGQWSCL
jgi:hypothetical protein